MIILTIFFIVASLYKFNKLSFKDTNIAIVNIQIDKVDDKEINTDDVLTFLFGIFCALSMCALNLYYYCLTFPIAKYPTLFMLVLLVLCFIYNSLKSKSKGTPEEERAKLVLEREKLIKGKATFSMIIFQLIHLIFFSYILYLEVI